LAGYCRFLPYSCGVLIMKIEVGDRLLHHTGSVWTIKEILSGSVMMGIGSADSVAVGYDELFGYCGEMPYAKSNFRLIE